ncbi:MAG: ATP-binding cassette domain-containing protein [Oscillospiraceae bacterium]
MLIETKGLTKIYRTAVKEPGIKGSLKGLFHTEWKEKTAVDSLTFQMEPGQAMACIGENGAGKSTLIKMLIGILHPSAGEVAVYGRPPTSRTKEYLRKIGVIFGQKTNLWTDIPVVESYNAIKTLYKVDAAEFKRNIDEVVELLELASILSSPARKLSLGQRMKADIGMIFLHSPEILYLDEPTIGLDINVKHTIRAFVRRMNRERGVSVFLTSHDLDDIDEICDDAIVLSGGKLSYSGSLADLKHRYVTGKTVTVIGEEKADICALLPAAEVTRDERRTKIVYDVETYTSEEILAALSKAFEIDDISIQEPDIDYVVSKIFDDGAKANGNGGGAE